MNTQITSAAFAASGEDASSAEFYLADCVEAEGFAEALQAAGGRFERLAGAPADWQAAEQRPVLVIYERAETAVCQGTCGRAERGAGAGALAGAGAGAAGILPPEPAPAGTGGGRQPAP